MSEVLHEITVPDSQPYFNFYHGGKEYVIWLWLLADETDQAYQINLSPVIYTKGYYASGTTLIAANATEPYANAKGGVLNVVNEVFLVRVNEYLASLGGEVTTFPVDATQFKQWLFLLEKGFSYSNGKVILVA